MNKVIFGLIALVAVASIAFDPVEASPLPGKL